MIEKNYQPDGWLGLVVGAKFWIDFTKKAAFINDISKLKREIGSRGKMLTETAKAIDEVDLAGKFRFNFTCLVKHELSCWMPE